MIWPLVLRGGAALSAALAGIQFYDLFFREIRPNRIYSSTDAARFLGTERRDVVLLLKGGKIKGALVDGSYRILGQSLLDYINK